MNIGQLDKEIDIYQSTGVTDDWNHEVSSLALVGRFWANVIYKSGTEKQSSDQRVNVDKVEFLIRYQTGLSPRDTSVFYASKYHDVHSIEIIGRNEALRLITTVRDNSNV